MIDVSCATCVSTLTSLSTDFAAFFSQPRASFSTPFSKLVSPMASVAVCVGWCTT